MTARVFLIAIGFGAVSIFSDAAQAQIRIGGGNHYPRNRYRNYDRVRPARQPTVNHYRRDQRRDVGHAVKDAVTDVITRGTTDPYRSPRYNYYDQRQQNNHYRPDRYRNYDRYAGDRNLNSSHYQPRRYRR